MSDGANEQGRKESSDEEVSAYVDDFLAHFRREVFRILEPQHFEEFQSPEIEQVIVSYRGEVSRVCAELLLQEVEKVNLRMNIYRALKQSEVFRINDEERQVLYSAVSKVRTDEAFADMTERQIFIGTMASLERIVPTYSKYAHELLIQGLVSNGPHRILDGDLNREALAQGIIKLIFPLIVSKLSS